MYRELKRQDTNPGFFSAAERPRDETWAPSVGEELKGAGR